MFVAAGLDRVRSMEAEKMYGTVVGVTEDGTGAVANMYHPSVLTGLVLPFAQLCITATYPDSPGARVRITDRRCPGLPVGKGDLVTAVVDVDVEPTGEPKSNPAARNEYGGFNQGAPMLVQEVRIVGGSAIKWGLALGRQEAAQS